MDGDGRSPTRLAEVVPYGGSFVFWPVGDQIAFVSDKDGGAEIYRMALDGSDRVRLTDVSGYNFSPDPSPDGTLMAFVSQGSNSKLIYVMDAGGGGVTRLTKHRPPTFRRSGRPMAVTSCLCRPATRPRKST
jgi:TolB protein